MVYLMGFNNSTLFRNSEGDGGSLADEGFRDFTLDEPSFLIHLTTENLLIYETLVIQENYSSLESCM